MCDISYVSIIPISLEGTGISPKPGWSTSPTTPADRPYHEYITVSSQPHMLNNLRTPVFGICSPANVSLFSSQQCSRYGTLLLRQQGHPVVGVEDDDDRSPMATVAVTHNGERQKISRLPRWWVSISCCPSTARGRPLPTVCAFRRNGR